MDFLDSKYPILNRLVTQNVNVDELDYLAKRLESFCESEKDQFQAMAFKFCLSDIKDFINLTFCCQQATVITDFSDLERVGKAHSLTISGGSMPMEKFDQVDGQAVALDLIQNGGGMTTPLRRGLRQRHGAGTDLRWTPSAGILLRALRGNGHTYAHRQTGRT